jgi:hypothetical protein
MFFSDLLGAGALENVKSYLSGICPVSSRNEVI